MAVFTRRRSGLWARSLWPGLLVDRFALRVRACGDGNVSMRRGAKGNSVDDGDVDCGSVGTMIGALRRASRTAALQGLRRETTAPPRCPLVETIFDGRGEKEIAARLTLWMGPDVAALLRCIHEKSPRLVGGEPRASIFLLSIWPASLRALCGVRLKFTPVRAANVLTATPFCSLPFAAGRYEVRREGLATATLLVGGR